MKIMRLYIISLFLAASIICLSPAVLAQSCGVTPEVIITLRDYSEGNYNVWDYVYGEKHMERFTDAIELSNNNLVVAGYTFPNGRPRDTRPLLVQVTRRNHVIWENRHEQLDSQIKLLRLRRQGEGFVAFGEMDDEDKGNLVWIGYYSEEGKLAKQVKISNPDYDLHFEEITDPAKGGGYVLAVRAIDKKYRGREHGVIYRVSPDGKLLWKRSYKPGISNRFHGITTVHDESGIPFYIAVGSFDVDAYRRSGFIVAVDEKGRLSWSEQYSRGLSATFRSVVPVTDGDFAVIGDVEPLEGDYNQSAWIMRVETESGDTQWQRFVAVRDYEVYGREVFGYKDGRIIAGLETIYEADDQDGNNPEMVRLLTLTPRGVIIEDEPYLEGTAVRLNELKLNEKQHRVLIGYAKQSFKADNEDNPYNFRTEDGWIIFAPSLDPYRDPCIPRRRYYE